MSLLKIGFCPALTHDIFDKLSCQGLIKVLDFLKHDPEEVTKLTDIPFKDVMSIRTLLLAQYSAPVISGSDLFQECLSSFAILPTGCESVNVLLDGGLYTGELTEIVAEAGGGKTQLCISCALQVATELEQNVVYIDTGGGFDVCRIQDILEARDISENEMCPILDRIQCRQAFDIFELLSEVDKVKSSLNDSSNIFHRKVKLVIVDSITSVISPILGGNQDGHGYMMHLARALKNIAKELAVSVLVTNNTVGGKFEPKPALGKSWSHIPNVRIHLSKHRLLVNHEGQGEMRNCRKAVLIKHTRQDLSGCASFHIEDSGLETIEI